MATKEEIKAAKAACVEALNNVRAAEAVLQDALKGAAPAIGALIKTAGHPGPHKFRLSPNADPVMFSFRKVGDYIPEGSTKAAPLYGVKELIDTDE